MTQQYKTYGGLHVAAALADFVANEVAPDSGITPEHFWTGFARIVRDLTPTNRALLAKRDDLQRQIDAWHIAHPQFDATTYQQFLTDIGYLVPAGADFKISTRHVDDAIAKVAGPQLVVPASNARFALNAANARWGSLYDALYGTDAISDSDGCVRGRGYNPARGEKVVQWGAAFLDEAIPLALGSHAAAVQYEVKKADEQSEQGAAATLIVHLQNGEATTLANRQQWVGWAERAGGDGADGGRLVLLFRNNGLHIELCIDAQHPIEQASAAGVCDIILESAVSTIVDCEDSVAAVDADDKTAVYRNWLGLMRGTLEATFEKSGKSITRALADDRHYTAADGKAMRLPGRSLLLVRNVGHLMTTAAVRDQNNDEIYEGLLDAGITAFCAVHDLRKNGKFQNSQHGSIYIVKPKMHGAEEAAFTNTLFARVEELLGLPAHTLKVGLMDEERRTSANLQECIRAVQNRLVFINTGFLDRTGDEIHTCMEAGAVYPKAVLREQAWLDAYEARNVQVGLQCGLGGVAQIGKGMWAMPDEMQKMLASKHNHPQAGASCAWVPSPTAATLHATHYHKINVWAQQASAAARPLPPLADLLTPPLMTASERAALLSPSIQQELDNNAQGILGYVVRWVNQGIGCSKVLDIHHVGLMEDRATLRIASQLLANWLRHGLCNKTQVLATLKRMAAVVDEQNAGDPAYRPLVDEGGDWNANIAFAAACELVFDGCNQPNGYTEPALHRRRAEAKASKK